MGTPILVIPEKIGVQEPTGHVYRGRTQTATFLEIHRLQMTTAGTQTPPRLSFQFQMKGQKMETLHNKPMI